MTKVEAVIQNSKLEAVKNALPPGVLQTQIAPQLQAIIVTNTQHIPANLIEPQHTFRFTVGKTF